MYIPLYILFRYRNSGAGYTKGLNCYSSPFVTCDGVKTGTSTDNVKAAIQRNAGTLSGFGNEGGACYGTRGQVFTKPGEFSKLKNIL